MPADAVLRALGHVWLALRPLNIQVALMGGLALAAWKHVRATRDVDLLLGIAQLNPNRVVETLRVADIRPKRDPPQTTALGQLEVVPFLYEPPDTFVDLQIDLLLAKSDYHYEALRRRVSTRLPDLDLEIAVLACEDLILHKLLAGRLIDRADAAALLRANRDSIDFAYLTHWAQDLKLTPGLTEVWSEASPGVPLPDIVTD